MDNNTVLEDLFIDLGLELHQSTSLSASMPKKVELIAEGKEWWNKNEKLLQSKICREEHLLRKNSDKKTLTTAIADLLSGIITGVAPFTVAAIAIEMGLNKWCDAYDLEEKHS